MKIEFFKILCAIGLLLSVSCATSSTSLPDSPNPVLEPMDPVAEEIPIEPTPTVPELGKLQAKLSELGYEGVGLDLESPSVLTKLLKLFSTPSVAHKKIRTVYTGATTAYDAAQESFTINPSQDIKAILGFVKKIPSVTPSKKR